MIGGTSRRFFMSRQHQIRFGAVAAACGAVAGFSLPMTVVAVATAAAGVLAVRWRFFGIVAFCIACGGVRGLLAIPEPLPAVNAVFQALVTEEPTATSSVFFVRMQNGVAVRVTGGSPVLLEYGDEIRLKCTAWSWNSIFENPQCRGSGIKIVAHVRIDPVRTAIHVAKLWFQRAINGILPNPEAPLLAGLLLGSRDDIPAALKQSFRLSGTSHIVAVSGFNVTVVVMVIASFFRLLPLPRVVRSAMIVAAIAGFVTLTGASASVVRAGLMGSLAIIGKESGRLGDTLHALILSAAVMVVWDPRIVASIGFQLSVAATLGLILLSEPVERLLQFVPTTLGVRSSLSTTLSAILMTQPLITLYFLQLSLVAPLVNLVVLPMIPLAMLTGFCAALVGALVPPFAPYIGWIAWAPLAAIMKSVDYGAKLPFASVTLGPIWSIAIASSFAALSWFIATRSRKSTDA